MLDMEDPYKILEIDSSASPEEVTKAYRRMAKKYHPDLNPGDKAAEQKMRQVNAAYEQIKTQKTGGVSYERTDGSYGPQRHNQPGGGYSYRGDDPFGGFDFGGFGDIFGDIFGDAWQQQGNGQSGSPVMWQARLYIQAQQYQNALHMLSQIHEREAEWYYLSAIANAGAGNRVTALSHAKEAVRSEPGNADYQQLLDQFQQGSFTYRQAGQSHGFDMQRVGSSLLQIMVAQIVCFFCCRQC
jgi:molecular chaperone DnaJ